MLITCEFHHDQYGPLTLTGQLHEAESDVNLDAHAVLESAIADDGKELLEYYKGNHLFFSREDIKEMEAALLYRGEAVVSRAKPTPETIAFVRSTTVK